MANRALLRCNAPPVGSRGRLLAAMLVTSSLAAGRGHAPVVPAVKPLLRLRGGGYALGLRDSIMIAHSFKGSEFGPAQNMHGATYTVDVEFHVKDLVLALLFCASLQALLAYPCLVHVAEARVSLATPGADQAGVRRAGNTA
jgi:hypothetical protein